MTALSHEFLAFTIGGLTIGALYGLVAFGYTIVYRILGLFHFAHGGVFMVGTFIALIVARGLGVGAGSGTVAIVGAILLMALAAMAVGTVLSVLMEYAIYRPIRVRQGGGLPALVAALGALTLLQEIVARWQGRDQVPVPQLLGSDAVVHLGGGAIYPRHLVVLIVVVASIVILDRYVASSRQGRALRAVGQDAKTASLMGINVQRVVLISFVLAGMTVGIAATLSDLYFGSTSWFAGFQLGIKGITAALLGGMGTVTGALVGGLALGLAESYGSAVFGAQWQDVIAFVALVLMLILRPTGIVGERLALVRA